VSNAITISVSGVTLDLSGFTITSTVSNAVSGGYAVFLGNGLSDLTILNGHIRSGVTNNGGVYTGSGFSAGIYYSGIGPMNTRVAGVSVSGCLNYGIYLNQGDSTVVESCTVRTIGGNGIYASTIKSCVAVDCYVNAIYGDQVSDSRGEGGYGYGLIAKTALNCFGSSSNNFGLFADNANNCSGSSTNGVGLGANYGAQNCSGSSVHSTGLTAYNASFCTGNRPGGTAIQATIATGCIAANGTNIITYKYNMP
jgi:hypothetical protein